MDFNPPNSDLWALLQQMQGAQNSTPVPPSAAPVEPMLAALRRPQAAPPARVVAAPPVPRAIAQQRKHDPVEDAKLDTLIGLQQKGANDLRDAADFYGQQPAQIDFSPLMSLADSWSGTHQAQNYKAPATPQEKVMDAAKLSSLANEAQTGVAKTELSRHLGDDKNDLGYLARVLAGGKAVDAANDKNDRAALSFTNQMENNYLLKKIKEKGLALDTVDQLAGMVQGDEPNTVGGAALGAQMARAMGEVGVLTEQDVKRYTTSKKFSQGALDTMSNWMNGKPSDATVNEIREIAQMMKEVQQKKVAPIYKTYVNRMAANLHMTREEAAKRLDVPMSVFEDGGGSAVSEPAPKARGKSAAPPAPGGGGDGTITPDELKELEMLKAKHAAGR